MRRGRKAVKRTRLRCSGSVFPLSDGGKNAVAVSSASFPEALSVCLTGAIPSEEGVAGQFATDTGGDCRFIIGAPCLTRVQNALNVLLLGFDKARKTQVGQRVFVRAEDQRVGGKPRSFSSDPRICGGVLEYAHSRLQIRYRHKRGLAHQGCDKRCGQAYGQERSAPKSRPPKRIRYRPLSPCDHMDQRGFPDGPQTSQPVSVLRAATAPVWSKW